MMIHLDIVKDVENMIEFDCMSYLNVLADNDTNGLIRRGYNSNCKFLEGGLLVIEIGNGNGCGSGQTFFASYGAYEYHLGEGRSD